ncbi:hypothetical protein V6N13_142566 [Hibiscus sabdariffa]|uniref:Uncharacterized protein n=1 Tax=Hibiscus sabdariffa TaxID=183260 RepID=A0ABR2FEL9_9ROSI
MQKFDKEIEDTEDSDYFSMEDDETQQLLQRKMEQLGNNFQCIINGATCKGNRRGKERSSSTLETQTYFFLSFFSFKHPQLQFPPVKTQTSSVGSNDPHQGSELQQCQRSSVGSNAPHQGSQLHRCQMSISHDPYQGSELQQCHCQSSVGSDAPHQGSKRQHCEMSSVGSNDPNQGQRSLVGSVDPYQGQSSSVGAKDPHQSIELQCRQTSSLPPSNRGFFKPKRGIAKQTRTGSLRWLRTMMEETRKDEELLRESQREHKKTTSKHRRRNRETREIIRQSTNTQIRLALMFKILMAQQEGDFTLAYNLIQLLREICAIMSRGSTPKRKK